MLRRIIVSLVVIVMMASCGGGSSSSTTETNTTQNNQTQSTQSPTTPVIQSPTSTPTEVSTSLPMDESTSTPTPTVEPTITPTVEPSTLPSVVATAEPTPTLTPTTQPTHSPNVEVTPTPVATVEPTLTPKDTIFPVITLNGESYIQLTQTQTYQELGATATDNIDGNLEVTIDGEVNTTQSGVYTIIYSAIDSSGNVATIERTVKIIGDSDIPVSLYIQEDNISIRSDGEATVQVLANFKDGSYGYLDNGLITFETNNSSVAVVDSGIVTPIAQGVATIKASYQTLTSNGVTVNIVTALNYRSLITNSLADQYQYLIPSDASVESYDSDKFAIITGVAMDKEGNLLQDVRISILNHPQYGSTMTDSNGRYAIGLEGGQTLTVVYQKEEYLPLHREVELPTNNWASVEDVAMSRPDTKASQITLDANATSLHSSSVVSDERGEREATLVFDGITTATITQPDGVSKTLTDITVRATEFDTPESMPAKLPEGTAFTYCVALTIDEAPPSSTVEFDKNVVVYIDNFLGFEVGEIVPVGYYNEESGEWEAYENGVVVKLLDSDGDGVVDSLDSNGDDNPDDLNGNGSYEDEVAGLPNNNKYQVDKTYSRFEVPHFSSYDPNYGAKPKLTKEDEELEKNREHNSSTATKDEYTTPDCTDSYVDIQNQVYHEDIEIAGTDLTLHYSTKRVDGYRDVIKVSLSGTQVPSVLNAIVVRLEVAGQVITKKLTPNPINLTYRANVINQTITTVNSLTNQEVEFEWDGLDVYGNKVNGAVPAKISVGYMYESFYLKPPYVRNAFGQEGSIFTDVKAGDVIYWKYQYLTLYKQHKEKSIANGWSLSNNHFQSSSRLNSILFRGNGVDRVDEDKYKKIGAYSYNDYRNLDQELKAVMDSVSISGSYARNSISMPFHGELYIDLGGSSEQGHINPYRISLTQNFNSNVGYIDIKFKDAYDEVLHSFYFYKAAGYDIFNYTSITVDDNKTAYIPNPYGYIIAKDGRIEIHDDYINGGFIKEGGIKTFGWDLENLSEARSVEIFIGARDSSFLDPGYALIPLYIKNTVDYRNIDGNLRYVFDESGKHFQTLDLQTNKVLTTFEYDENDRLIAIKDQFGNTLTIERDGSGNPLQITAPNGQVTTLSIDENNNLTSIGYEDSTAYSFEYDNGGLMLTQIDPNGNTFSHEFDENGRITRVSDSEGGWKAYTKEGNSYQVTTATDETKTIAMSGIDNSTTDASGTTTSTTYSDNELSLTQTSCEITSVTNYTYDERSNEKVIKDQSITLPSGKKLTTAMSRSYSYADNNSIKERTLTTTTNGKSATVTTNYLEGVTTTTTPQGRITKSYFDTDTLLPTKTQIEGIEPTLYSYDEKGRITTITQGERTQSYIYNVRGNVESITDASGKTTSFVYDIMDRVIESTAPSGAKLYYSYDKNGNMRVLTTPTTNEHTFAYNAVNKKVGYTTPRDLTTTYEYDASRRLTKVLYPSGKSIENIYTNGVLSTLKSSDFSIEYSYNCLGNIAKITKGDESIEYSYDGSLLTQITQSGVLSQTLNFGYNDDMLIASINYADKSYALSYDNDGLLISQGDYTITRESSNGMATKISDGTLSQTRSFSTYAELDSIDNTINNLPVYGYNITARDKNGKITQKEEYANTTTYTYDYRYDSDGRLVEVKRNGTVVENYSYDKNGNRISATSTLINATVTNTTTNTSDQLSVYGERSYTYDQDGYIATQTTVEGTTKYQYGTMGELRKVTLANGTVIEYLHNAQNQRIAKKVNGTITQKYQWLNLTTLLAIYDGNDNLVQRFNYADGRMPLSVEMEGNTYYLHYDQVGTLKVVSDSSGVIVKRIDYDSFGNIISDSNPSLTLPFGFAGGLYDSDTKLTRFGYRDYDSYSGRWMAKDPIGFEGGDSNLYGYVMGDSVNLIDPLGHNAGTITGIEIGSPLGPGGAVVGGILGTIFGIWVADKITNDSDDLDNNVCYAKKSKQSGKEKATDVPDWVRQTGLRPNPKQKCQDFAKQLLNAKYGSGNWIKGAGTEYNKIVKWCERSLK